jgi:hypothetical protein
MNPKPAHLGLKYAEQFKDPGLVAVYHYRRPYPDEDYLQSLHSMNGLSRERMGEEAAKSFDEEVWKAISPSPFLQEGQLHLSIVSTVVWGLPRGA